MQETWPRAAAADVKSIVERAAAADTGGDGTLSHGRNLGSATATVRETGTGASVTVQNPRVWGVLEKAGRRPRRTWSRAVASALPKAKASARRAFDEVVG